MKKLPQSAALTVPSTREPYNLRNFIEPQAMRKALGTAYWHCRMVKLIEPQAMRKGFRIDKLTPKPYIGTARGEVCR